VADDRYRCSFDAIAEVYERTRPMYADEALAHIERRLPLHRVVDVGAGTGKLTRQLVALGADVVAVEPGDSMRAVLARVVPEAEALAGTAEDLPLPDESVDVVTVGAAFHWFRADEALAEMHRVLRLGGGCAFLWNEWDDTDPLLRDLNAVVERVRPRGTLDPDAPTDAIGASPLFGPMETTSFPHTERLDADTVAGLVSSISAIAVAAPAVQLRVEAEVRSLVTVPEVDFPLITRLVIVDRV